MAKETSNRGFASMDEDKQREAARKGGQNVPNEKRTFSQDPKLASEAGRKGGQESERTGVDRERASETERTSETGRSSETERASETERKGGRA
jgi:general stress protein YciG